MNTLLYEYLREETYNFWTTYTNRQSVPKEYHLQTFKLLGKQGSHFLNLLLELQLNTPLFKFVKQTFQHIQTEHYYLNIREDEIETIFCKSTNESAFSAQIKAKLQEQSPHWTKTSTQYTSFQHLIELRKDRVMDIIGFYIYDQQCQVFRVLAFNLDCPIKYSYKSQLTYYRLPYIRSYEVLTKAPSLDHPIDFEFIIKNDAYIKITRDELKTLLKHFPKKTIEQYLINKKFLEALDLRIFTDLQSAEIDRLIGYETANSFQNAFKNHFGMCPGDVQKLINIL